MTTTTTKPTTTKVFRIEVLKPLNYTWPEFQTIVNKASYASARLANEVVLLQYLIAKGKVERNGNSFCSLMGANCADSGLNGSVKCSVCQLAKKRFQSSVKQVLRADDRLPFFRNNVLFFKGSRTRIQQDAEGAWVATLPVLPRGDGNKLQKQPQVMLRTLELQKCSPGYYQILDRIASGEYKLGTSQLVRDKRRGKLYLLMSYSFAITERNRLNPDRVMGIDLGVATPAYCALNDSLKRKNLSIEGQRLLKTKYQIERRRRATRKHNDQRDLRRGHGKTAKFRPLEQIESKWQNFRTTWNHTLAYRIVEFALQEQAGQIHLENLSPGHNGTFLGRMWPVHELLTMIDNKATEHGIKVSYVNPYKTSQTCSRCGAIAEEFSFKDRSRKGFPSFKCEACGFQDNADYNAAKNISKAHGGKRSDRVTLTIEQNNAAQGPI